MFGSSGYSRSRNLTKEQESYVRSPAYRKAVKDLHRKCDLWFNPRWRFWQIVYKTDSRCMVWPGRYEYFYVLKTITDPQLNLQEVRFAFQATRQKMNKEAQKIEEAEKRNAGSRDSDEWESCKESAKHLIGPTIQVPENLNASQ